MSALPSGNRHCRSLFAAGMIDGAGLPRGGDGGQALLQGRLAQGRIHLGGVLVDVSRPESPSAASTSARWRAARRLTKRLDTPMHKSSPQVHRMKFSPAGEVMALMPST